MTDKINRGYRYANDYLKMVDLNKAVLWKTKELSLPPEIVEKIKREGLENIIFVDKDRNQRLTIPVALFLLKAKLIQRHQEAQYYIHLSHLTSSKWVEYKESRDIKLD